MLKFAFNQYIVNSEGCIVARLNGETSGEQVVGEVKATRKTCYTYGLDIAAIWNLLEGVRAKAVSRVSKSISERADCS